MGALQLKATPHRTVNESQIAKWINNALTETVRGTQLTRNGVSFLAAIVSINIEHMLQIFITWTCDKHVQIN